MAQGHLVAFHLGTCGGEIRKATQGHLGACSMCLASYWELKEVMDLAAVNSERPAPEVRQRLTMQWQSLFVVEKAAKQLASKVRNSPVASLAIAAAVAACVLLLARQRLEPVRPSLPTSVERIQDPLMQRDARTMTL